MNKIGRIYQNKDFDVAGFTGEKIEEILGVVDHSEADNHPMVINLRTENQPWQRYFLDAGIGFWENWGELVDKEDEDNRFVNYGEIFQLKRKVIQFIKCRNGKISIEMENK